MATLTSSWARYTVATPDRTWIMVRDEANFSVAESCALRRLLSDRKINAVTIAHIGEATE